jgi:hypothetical protein
MFISIQKITPIAIIASFLSLGSLITANSVNAYGITFSNGDFENSTLLNGSNGWTGIGSTDIRGTYSGVNPSNTQQGVITTACPNSNSTFCQNSRNDDPGTTTGTFNLLGKDQLSASPEIADLQTSLGLSPNALSIFREIGGVKYDGTSGNPILYRTPKEGSAIFQNITIGSTGNPTDTLFTFNYDFLTNDGAGSLGDKDFGFFSISGNGLQEVISLEDSTGSIPAASGTNYATNTNPYQSRSVRKTLAPGTYKISFGVVDVDGSGNSSAFLLDNFNAEAVPFEFSPTAGLGLVVSIFGLSRLRRKFRNDKALASDRKS